MSNTVIENELKEVQSSLKAVNADLRDYSDKTMQRYNEVSARLHATEQFAAKIESQGQCVPIHQHSVPSSGILSGDLGPKIRVLAKGQPLSRGGLDYNGSEDFSLSHFCRAGMGFERAQSSVVTSGTGLVPIGVASTIIDAVRERSAIANSGAMLIEINGPTNMGRVDGDAEVFQHTESVNDISESIPIFSGVELNPKSLVCNIPLSAEVVADSPNLDALLRTSIAGAFAKKLDALCIAKILADSNVPTSSSSQDPASWFGVLAAIGSAMSSFDQQIPSAIISSPLDLIARASEAPTNSGWLNRPDLLKDLVELTSNSLDAGTAIFGNWMQSFAIVARSMLQLELVRYQKPGSHSHLLVASARIDGYVLQPGGLYLMEKTSSE